MKKLLLLLFVILTACSAPAPPPTATPPPSAAPSPSPTVDEVLPLPQPDDVIFLRPGGERDEFVLGMQEAEVWAVGRDGQDARLLATFEPPTYERGLSRSPDGRTLLITDTNTLLRFDLTTGQPEILFEAPRPQPIGDAVWVDDTTFYYAQTTLVEGGGDSAINLWRQTLDADADLLREDVTVGKAERPAYPTLALPDGRLIMGTPQDARLVTWGIYDPDSDRLLPVEASGDLIVHDARAAEVAYTVGDTSAYLGQIGPAGELVEALRLSDPADVWLYTTLRFLGDGRLLALRYSPEGPQAASELVIIDQDGTITPAEVPAWDDRYIREVRLLDDSTALLTVVHEKASTIDLWLYTVDGEARYLITQVN